MLLVVMVSWGVAGCSKVGSAGGSGTQRTADQIQQDIDAACKDPAVLSVFDSMAVLTDETRRNEIAPKALPQLKIVLRLADELAATDKGRASGQHLRNMLLPVLAVFGDAETNTRLEAMAQSGDANEASAAKSAMFLARWWKGSNDAVVQGRVLDDAEALAKSDPESDTLSQDLMVMGQGGATTPGLRDRALSIIAQDIKGDAVAPLQEQVAALQKLYAMENKPLEIEGVRFGGGTLTTADWKGKVVLVDFWATWCGPCVAELPDVKKVYAEYHDKGLEVLGISCDNSGADLRIFLKANKDMPWPQLFDEKTPGWHALASQYGIVGIPTMLLIDKHGIVRTASADQHFVNMIPPLLAE